MKNAASTWGLHTFFKSFAGEREGELFQKLPLIFHFNLNNSPR